jgi:uncharacterized protein (TIGR02145 family)
MNRTVKSLTVVAGALLLAVTLDAQGIRMLNHTRNGNVIKGIEVSEVDSIKFVRFTVPSTASGVEIAGIKWATSNVDAPGTFAATPTDAGMLYQWNRTTGWSSTDPLVNHEGGTAWDATDPTGKTWTVDNNVCPAGWRVPTDGELQSLIDAGNFWGTMNGVTGQFFGSDEQRIFLPAASYRYWENGMFPEIDPGKPGTFGGYLASTRWVINLGGEIDFGPYAMYFHRDACGMDSNTKAYAYPLRCVKAQDNIVTFEQSPNGTLAVTAGNTPVTSGDIADYGTALVITATPNEGYELQSLKVNGENFANDSTLWIEQDIYIEVLFREDESGIINNTLTGVTVQGIGNSVHIVNPHSISLKSVQIVDVLGRVVYDGRGRTFSTPTEAISVNGASGIYVVRLLSDDNKVLSTKVQLN